MLKKNNFLSKHYIYPTGHLFTLFSTVSTSEHNLLTNVFLSSFLLKNTQPYCQLVQYILIDVTNI